MMRSVDVAGVTVTVPDPDEISGLSARFQAMGDALADATDRLSALTSPEAVTSWTGPAADAFGQTIGPLPGHLGTARDAYQATAAALSEYAGQLRPVVAILNSLASRASDATGSLNATQAARDQIFRQDPLSPDLAGLDARLADSHSTVTGLQAQARAQQSDMRHLAATCTARIRHAMPGGKKPGLLGRLGHDFMNDVAKPVGRGAEAAAKEVVKMSDNLVYRPFEDLAKDTAAFARDPSWQNLSKSLVALTDVIGTLGLLVPGLGEVLAPFVLPVAAAALATDAAAVGSGETGIGHGLRDALDVGLAGKDQLLEEDIDAERAALKDARGSGEADHLAGTADDATDDAADGTADDAADGTADDAADGTADDATDDPTARTPASESGGGGGTNPPAEASPATGPANADQQAAPPPGAPGGGPDEPQSPYLEQLEQLHTKVQVAELANTALAPDDSSDHSHGGLPAPTGRPA